MSNVTSIFGQSIPMYDASKMHSSYGDSAFISRDAIRFNRNSNEFKKVTSAYYFNNDENVWQRAWFLKSDCVRYHRNPRNEGNTYIANISLDKTFTILYDNKQLYFLNEQQSFDAGYIFSLSADRWLDLKVTDKHMYSNSFIVIKDGKKRLIERYSAYHSTIADRIIESRQRTFMEQCPSRVFRISYYKNDADNVVHCSLGNRMIVKSDSHPMTLFIVGGICHKIYADRFQYRMIRGEQYMLFLADGTSHSHITYRGINHNNYVYFDSNSAEQEGYVSNNVACPSCGNEYEFGTHDTNACSRRNHRNPRYEYHSRDFQTKQIQMEQKIVFKVGVEIEKQSYFGSKHSNVAIGQQFGWKKERDGSLCGTIGYELVSPCYPLFTDDLINEAKEIEQAFPELINGNDHTLISSDKDNSSCGGHIHFSRSYTSAKDTFEMVSGYMPFIYAIYRKRSETYYSIAKEKSQMKNSTEKMQAVRIIEDIVNPRIEFRIFPLVKNIDQLQWRIDLLRIIAMNPTNRFPDVANDLCNKESDLYKHMLKEFSPSKIKQRILDAIQLCKRFDNDFRNFDFSRIEESVNNL